VEILGVHGAFYYDYQTAAFQVATQFNQNPTSSFDHETCRRTNVPQYYEYSSRKKKKKAEEQNTDFGVGGGGLSFLKTGNVEANNYSRFQVGKTG
jgi:hypothetical protein